MSGSDRTSALAMFAEDHCEMPEGFEADLAPLWGILGGVFLEIVCVLLSSYCRHLCWWLGAMTLVAPDIQIMMIIDIRHFSVLIVKVSQFGSDPYSRIIACWNKSLIATFVAKKCKFVYWHNICFLGNENWKFNAWKMRHLNANKSQSKIKIL